MKGIKCCLVGVCIGLVGIAAGTGNGNATFLTGVGLFVSFIGLCIKD